MSAGRVSEVAHPSSDHAGAGSWYVDTDATAGVNVTESTALTFSAYFDAIRVIAEDIAKLSHVVYRRIDGGKTRAPDHPAYRLLHTRPNHEMTAFSFRETLQGWALSWGNGYAEIEYNRAGRPIAMWPIKPNRVRIDRDSSGQLFYDVSNQSGSNRVLMPHQMFHVHGLGSDGIQGYSVARMARQSLGIGMAAEQFQAKFFGNGGTYSAVLEHPGELSEAAQKRIRKSHEDTYGGVRNAFKLMILEEGMKLNKWGMSMEDAQMLLSREFQVTEICRWFRLPPHKLAHLNKATFSNIEHQAIEYVVDTMLPWAVRWDQEAGRKLFAEGEQDVYFAELMLESLLRGDIKSRYDAYHVALQDGWINRDEVRARENLNPMPDGQGQVFLFPLNFAPAAKVIAGDASAPSNHGARGAEALLRRQFMDSIAASQVRIVSDAAGRVLRKEANAVDRASKKHADREAFAAWLDEFIADQRPFARIQVLPAIEAMIELAATAMAAVIDATALASTCSDVWADDHMETLRREMLAAFDAGVVIETTKQWDQRADGIARSLCDRAVSAAMLKSGDPNDGNEEETAGLAACG